MTNTTLILDNIELTKHKIIHLLDRLTIEYQNCANERGIIINNYVDRENEFSLLEEIELLTTDIRGYASQIKAINMINNPQIAVNKLQKMQIFNIPSIADFYFNKNLDFPFINNYLQMLDYLRLLILEYLSMDKSHQKNTVLAEAIYVEKP